MITIGRASPNIQIRLPTKSDLPSLIQTYRMVRDQGRKTWSKERGYRKSVEIEYLHSRLHVRFGLPPKKFPDKIRTVRASLVRERVETSEGTRREIQADKPTRKYERTAQITTTHLSSLQL